MKYNFIAIAILMTFSLNVNAQEIKVKLMEQLPNDLAARTHPRLDGNGVECALIRVVVPAVKDMKFEGWVIGESTYQPGEYQVYVPENTKKIKFRHESYEPGEIVFNMPIESKCVYKVVLDIPDLQKIYVTQSSAMLAEGSRLYELRKYAEARQSYEAALNADDVVTDLIPTIQNNIAQCDTCLLYEKYTLGAFSKIREMRNQGTGSQEDLVRYASAAIEYLHVLNRYNSCDLYTSRIKQLEEIVKDLPMEIRFSLVRWVNNESGFYEGEMLRNIEVWEYTGNNEPVQSSYKNDKKFLELVGKSTDYRQLAISDEDGLVDLQFDRDALPNGLFFRPVGYDDKIKILYLDVSDMLSQSKGNYNKRRIRIKMFGNY